MRRLAAVCLLLTLGAASARAGDAATPLETLAPDGALVDVRSHAGVVFVDLFADW